MARNVEWVGNRKRREIVYEKRRGTIGRERTKRNVTYKGVGGAEMVACCKNT